MTLDDTLKKSRSEGKTKERKLQDGGERRVKATVATTDLRRGEDRQSDLLREQSTMYEEGDERLELFKIQSSSFKSKNYGRKFYPSNFTIYSVTICTS